MRRIRPRSPLVSSLFFFFNDTATTEIYTLSLHDALPIFSRERRGVLLRLVLEDREYLGPQLVLGEDRKSTRLNSSHERISYAVFCLKKKKRKVRAPWRRPTNISSCRPSRRTPAACHRARRQR